MNQTASVTRFGSRGRWSALNIVLMVVGFATFWPLGLAMLAWIVWGDEIGARTQEFKSQLRSFSGHASSYRSGPASAWSARTGNLAFDEYREREMKRIDEERRKLDGMKAEFETFVTELRRVKDQEEFDRFMRDFRGRTSDGENVAG